MFKTHKYPPTTTIYFFVKHYTLKMEDTPDLKAE